MLKRSLLLSALLTLSAGASATVWKFEIDNPPGSDGAGDVKNVTTTFDDVNEIFAWEYTIGAKSGNYSDGFWLVVSDGPNPKGVQNELAIFYGDVDTNTITAYQYNGLNSDSSYINPGEFIESFSGALTSSIDAGASTRTIGFSIDVSGVNSYVPTPAPSGGEVWEGARFDDKIGIWFHPTLGTEVIYDSATAEITDFDFTAQSWYDTSNQTTTTVPAPAPLVLFGIVLAALGLRRSRV